MPRRPPAIARALEKSLRLELASRRQATDSRGVMAAVALLEKLGFHSTPVSMHQVSGKPAGTSNRCVMLREGYLEILAPTLDTPNARRVRARMARYAGVHLVCYGTPSAEAEHARLAAHGFEPEPPVELRRRIEGGKEVGGLCILRGCMPSKTLLYSTEVLHLARQGKTFGLTISHSPGYELSPRGLALLARLES